MKLKLAIIFFIALVVLAKFTYDQMVPPFKSGETAPDFALTDMSGAIVRLSDFKGNPVIVHFWATWCSTCVEEMPLLNNFAASHPEIKILAVNEDEGGLESVSQFFKNMKPAFTVLLDTGGMVSDRYKSYKVPESFLLNKDGGFVHRFVGMVPWDNPKIADFIKKKLNYIN